MILAYGKRWNRSLSEKHNFKDVRKKEEGRSSGLYILYNKKRIVYVGKSIAGLRARIRQHTADHLKNKWDSFTWFLARKRFTSELEALLHNIFWDIKVHRNIQRARLKGKKYSQKHEIENLKIMSSRSK
jgi:hypothetical protein